MSVHSFAISICKNIPRFTSPKCAVCSMTPSSSMNLDFNSFLAWQRIHFGGNPAGSKGFSHHPCHAFQGKCSSTTQGHSILATCYTPHSPVSSHTALEVCTALTNAHCPIGSYSPCSMYNSFLTLMTVKSCVFPSGRSSYGHFHSTSEP